MSAEHDSFLARWSRRKREAQHEEPPAGAPGAAPEPASPESEPELSPEEIAALPKLEELTPATDVTVFLRKGVPEALRKAALRRIWSLDPAIRDYVGDARDYAYDWNLAGAVPGNGPLLPTDDVEAMVRQVFDGATRRDGSESAHDQAAEQASHDSLSQDGERELLPAGAPEADRDQQVAAAQRPASSEPGDSMTLPPPVTLAALEVPDLAQSSSSDGDPAAFAAARSGAASPPGSAPTPRRHGRAKPV